MHWQLKRFSELSLDQLYVLLQLRTDIFVVEQQCPYPELDGYDRMDGVYHLLGVEGTQLQACLRLIAPSLTSHGHAAIGRVAVREEARGSGLGHQLLQQGLAHCQRLWPDYAVQVSAQLYLEAFYAAYGFNPLGESYLEDGIPHLDMRYQPPTADD